MSLKTRARTWWTPGLPLAVGGPSQKTHGSAPSRRRTDSWNTSRSRQRARTCSSSSGKDCCGSTGRRAIWRRIVGAQPAVPPARCNTRDHARGPDRPARPRARRPPRRARSPWSAPRSVTVSGLAREPAVALGGPDAAAVAYVRHIDGADRVELRQGTVDRLRTPVIVDRDARHGLDSPTLTYRGHDDAARLAALSRREHARARALGGVDRAAEPRRPARSRARRTPSARPSSPRTC